ncbi:hypothetical protein LMG28138_05426 [Pararobbsia alpina]|uniref:Uncharacterized protein n=1 Tax=Pararobbsia alpina TaxID=621374 RepID=A0A6S7C981_9BURK|nr:hypothetical protein LMG28138_05426 [Pararobbsia alpina]
MNGNVDYGTSSPAPLSALGDPLASARARGRRFAAEEYRNSANQALADARSYTRHSESTINDLPQNGKLYALLPPGKTGEFRYPKWQLDARPLGSAGC